MAPATLREEHSSILPPATSDLAGRWQYPINTCHRFSCKAGHHWPLEPCLELEHASLTYLLILDKGFGDDVFEQDEQDRPSSCRPA